MKSRTRKTPSRAPVRRSRLAAVAAILPLAVSMIPSRTPSAQPTVSVARLAAATKEFSVPLGNLRDWARTVVVTLDDVSVEGHSNVHPLDNDCEIHLGAHTPAFRGEPDGL